jgi:hypothetical protein
MTRTYAKTATRITLILGVIVFLAYVFVIRGAFAGATFATNTGQVPLELKIDSTTFYNGVFQPALSWTLKNLTPGVDKFFNFGDVKPGDTGTSSISIHINKGPAFACLDFTNLKDLENGINEPESHVDSSTTTGELAEGLEFFAWRDDGDKKFEVGEKPLFGTSTQSGAVVLNNTTYALADAVTGAPYQSGSTNYVGIYWCAGDMTVDVPNAKVTCNGLTLGNEAQTDSLGVDVRIRAVASSQQPKFTCGGQPPPVTKCEIEGHKFDKNGNPLKDWNIGLMKTIVHNKGTDTYDLATSTTNVNGYYCLDWNGEKRTPRGTPTYKSGPYTFEYHVFEILKTDWKNVSVQKGPNEYALSAVPDASVKKVGQYVSTSLGSGYIIANAAYHVDFYNEYKAKVVKGNNGHGNDTDGNDNSNPGNSNNPNDNTDDDNLPPGFVKKAGESGISELSGVWRIEKPKTPLAKLVEKSKAALKRLKS